jgi:hypothetical protein
MRPVVAHFSIPVLIASRIQEGEELLDDIRQFVPQAKLAEPAIFAQYQKSLSHVDTLGDEETARTVREMCGKIQVAKVIGSARNQKTKRKRSESEDEDKEPDEDDVEWTLTSQVKHLVEQLVVSIRSLRYLQNLQQMRKNGDKLRCGNQACAHKTSDDLGVSAHCGHAICTECFGHTSLSGDNACPAPGCSATIYWHHLLWSHKIARNSSKEPAPYGAKIQAAVEILRRIQTAGGGDPVCPVRRGDGSCP